MPYPLQPGEVATTTRPGHPTMVVILHHVDSTGEPLHYGDTPTGEQSSICRAMVPGVGLLTGDPLLIPTSELVRAYLPVDQARSVYAIVKGIDLKAHPIWVPATPIGTREYAEYGARLREELRRFLMCPACGHHLKDCSQHATDEHGLEILTRHRGGDHSFCVAAVCGPRPSIAELMENENV